MRVLTYNINGFRSAAGKGLFGWLANEAADIVCFQETRAAEQHLPPVLIELPGYRAHWHSAEKKGYSGVGLLSREKPDRVVHGLGDALHDREGRLLRADFGDLSVLSLYVPSGITGEARQAHKHEFLGRLLDHLKALKAEGREVLLCGDLNIAHRVIDLSSPGRSQTTSGFLPAERAWLDSLLAAGFEDVFRRVVGEEPGHYTWGTAWMKKSGGGWRLDYQIATPKLSELARAAHIEKTAPYSDHYPVRIDYDWPIARRAAAGAGDISITSSSSGSPPRPS